MRSVLYPPPLCSLKRFRPASGLRAGRVDALLEYRRRLEHHYAARRDRHFFAGFRIAPDALALLAYHERAERRELHRFAALEAIGDFLEHQFNERRGLGARQSHLLVDRLAQIRAGDCFSGHRQPRLRRSRYLSESSDDMSLNRNGQRGAQIFRGGHQRTSADAQVKPPPIASSMTRSPRLIRPSATAAVSASGIEAAEVLPCLATVVITLCGGMPNFFAESSMMRWFA